mgnify:CR=1 FL=1
MSVKWLSQKAAVPGLEAAQAFGEVRQRSATPRLGGKYSTPRQPIKLLIMQKKSTEQGSGRATGVRKVRIDTDGRRLGDDRPRTGGFDDIGHRPGDLRQGDAAGLSFDRRRHPAGVNQNQMTGPDDIIDAADKIQRLLNGRMNLLIIRSGRGFYDRYVCLVHVSLLSCHVPQECYKNNVVIFGTVDFLQTSGRWLLVTGCWTEARSQKQGA